MSVSTALKTAVAAVAKKPPTVQELDQKLAAAKTRQQSLQHDLEDAALAFTSGEPDADKAYQNVAASAAALLREIQALEAAKPAAARHAALLAAASRDAAHASQVRAVASHLTARDKAAAEMSKHLEEAIRCYQLAQKHAEKAYAAKPETPRFPEHNLSHFCDAGSIRIATEHEIYRLGADDTSLTQINTFPGGRPFSHQTRMDVSKMPSMEARLKEATAYVLSILQGRAITPAPVELVASPAATKSAPAYLPPTTPLKET